ncbi:MAG: SPFH domain-containing protein [Planctomycetota bacterium]
MPKTKFLVSMLVAAAFVVVLVLYSVTYTVRFTEVAVVTRLGQIVDTRAEPGLGGKLFYPIDSVTKYETTSRLTQAKIETYQTRDDRQLIIGAFAIWRIKPEEADVFYRRFGSAGTRDEHYEAAATLVEDTLRSAMSELSSYAMAELFTPNEGESRLDELEAAVLAQMKANLEGQGERSFGIEVQQTGLARVTLPQQTTEAALERMRQDRARLVTELEGQGESEAQAIRSTATSQANIIREFAENRAKEIRSLGEAEAAQYLAAMQANPDLAIFLKQLEMLDQSQFSRATLIFSTAAPGLNLLDPSLFANARPGEIPGLEPFVSADRGDAMLADPQSVEDDSGE